MTEAELERFARTLEATAAYIRQLKSKAKDCSDPSCQYREQVKALRAKKAAQMKRYRGKK